MVTDENIILLVEDNEDDIELTVRALREHNVGNEVAVARDGAEALDFLFRRGRFTGRSPRQQVVVVFLDLKLPKVPGTEVLRQIREHPQTRRLPVVVLTTSNEERDLIACYDQRANSYVRKPVDLDQFNAAIKQLGMYWVLLNERPPQDS